VALRKLGCRSPIRQHELNSVKSETGIGGELDSQFSQYLLRFRRHAFAAGLIDIRPGTVGHGHGKTQLARRYGCR
jgi:hypothetical protein